MVHAIQNYIGQRLINECKPVTFLNLCDEFSINSAKAKNEMIEYYSTTRHESIQCIVISVLKQNVVQMITDPENIPDKEDMRDFFIYAFNPLETIDLPNTERVNVTIKIPYQLSVPEGTRPKSSNDAPIKVISIPTQGEPQANGNSEGGTAKSNQRSKTFPEAGTKPAKPAKSMGLKSTELLARMRKEREEKERVRQEELERRKQQKQQKNHVVISQEKQKQLDQLASMFDDDDDDFTTLAKGQKETSTEKEVPEVIESIPSQDPEKQEAVAPTAHASLEELLDTTVDESLMEVSQNDAEETRPQEDEKVPEETEETTYIDEDGYMVTKRRTEEPKKQRKAAKSAKTAKSALPDAALPKPAPKPAMSEKKKGKAGQRTLESFFGKRK